MKVYSKVITSLAMKCFLSCFGFSSSSGCRKNHAVNAAEQGALQVQPTVLIQPTHQITAVQESIDWIAQSQIEEDEEESYNKAVVEPTDEVTIEESDEVKKAESDRGEHEGVAEECSESLFSLSLGYEGKPVSEAEPEVNSPMLQVPPTSCTWKEDQHQVEEGEGEPSEKEAKVENTTKVVEEEEKPNLKEGKVETTPMNHLVSEYRYQDCSEEDYDDDDDVEPPHTESDKKREYTNSSSESLFSLPTDGYRKKNSSAENEKEVSSAMLIQSSSPQVSSVLNPIENVSDVNVVRVRKPTAVESSLKEDKENTNLVDQLKPSSGLKMKKAMRVDSSFSGWLVESEESTPPSSHENRTILRALTAEETNQSSTTASSSHENRPILRALTAEKANQHSTTASSSHENRPILRALTAEKANQHSTTASSSHENRPILRALTAEKANQHSTTASSSHENRPILRALTAEEANQHSTTASSSHENRPILRALTAEEANQYSTTASSRNPRSPTTPDYDDTPIIGTDFGSSYWTHTRHKKSKSRMNANPNWSFTSVRSLEPALQAAALKMKKEMRVESSFSSRLVESKRKHPSKSKYSHEDRPIPRALPAEEISKHSSIISSTIPDYADAPIMGTDFGSNYCTHTRHKRSNSRMNVNPNWSSTSVRNGLEPAFQATLKMKKEIRVDNNFSSQLVESKSTRLSKSKYSHEDRPILGALTTGEISKYSSRKSRSPTTQDYDDTPIMETGFESNYWTHTRQKKSHSRTNANPNWSLTSFRTSLEPAFQATLKMKKEMRVDNSFSSRLVESERTPPSKSKYSHKDRPILRAFTVGEISKYSSTTSRKSRSPTTLDYDDTPIIGDWFWEQDSDNAKEKQI